MFYSTFNHTYLVNQSKKCLETAKNHSNQMLSKYVAIYSAELIKFRGRKVFFFYSFTRQPKSDFRNHLVKKFLQNTMHESDLSYLLPVSRKVEISKFFRDPQIQSDRTKDALALFIKYGPPVKDNALNIYRHIGTPRLLLNI